MKNNRISTKEKSETMNMEINEILTQALGKIAPLWSLENFVAVNPYLGKASSTFEDTARYYSKLNGSQLTMPLSFYLSAIDEGIISKKDVEKALEKSKLNVVSSSEFIKKAHQINKSEIKNTVGLQLLSDCAENISDKKWNSIMIDCTTSWASNYFDKGIASWNNTKKENSNFLSWKNDAHADRTPRIHGLKAFHSTLKSLPNNSLQAIEKCLTVLAPSEETLIPYLHALMMRVQGWSAYNAGLDWDANLYGGKNTNLQDFLAILLAWELAFFNTYENREIKELWGRAQKQNAVLLFELNEDESLYQRLVLQNAYDFACQRELIQKIEQSDGRIEEKKTRPLVQSIFCIDVRSEVYRRNFEMLSPEIETMGFAGFFAFPINYIPIGHGRGQNQCPALIPTGATVKEVIPDEREHEKAEKNRKKRFHLFTSWKSFRHSAVSCFGFVSPMGITYLPKLFMDAFGLTRPTSHPSGSYLSKKNAAKKSVSLAPENHNQQTIGLELNKQIELAKNALNAMSLTKDFAKLVLITGHGSSSTNNPHATGYDCGACGGNSGEVNAKVAAEVLNNSEVRFGLAKEGVKIPEDTHFIAAEHDTTTDEVRLFNTDSVPTQLKEELNQLKRWLFATSHTTRTERALRLNVGNKSLDRKIIG